MILAFKAFGFLAKTQQAEKEKVSCHQHVVRKCLAFKECITIDTCQIFPQNKAVSSKICIMEAEPILNTARAYLNWVNVMFYDNTHRWPLKW